MIQAVKIGGSGGGKRGRDEDVENTARGVVMGISDADSFKQPAAAYSNGPNRALFQGQDCSDEKG